MKKLVLSISLMTAMFFVSCEQDSANEDIYNTTSNTQSKNAAKAADCTPVTDNAVVYRTGTSSGNYCHWGSTTKTIGTVSVQFEGMYGGGIRPLTPGWYVGTTDLTSTCSTWNTWKGSVQVKNDDDFSIVTSPACGSVIIPENVVGANGVVSGLDFGLGYYEYQQPGGLTITKKIVIWKDANETDPEEPTSPSAATEAYLVQVTSIVPTFSSLPYYGTVSYTYTKVL